MNWMIASVMGKNLKRLFLFALLLCPVMELVSKSIPSKPGTIVNDYAGILTRAQNDTLEEKLRAWDRDSSSTQISIVIEKSLEGADLWTYCQELFNTWGIGQAKKNNGVLIYIASDDKRIRIHTGRGAEQFLGDARSARLIEEILQPAFRSGDYYGGLNRLTDRIIELSRGEYSQDAKGGYGVSPIVIFLVFFAFIVFLSFLNRNRDISRRGSRDHWNGPWNWPGGGWGGGGWSGGSGGGSSWGGFGGGSSGGGGASGSW